MSYADQEADMPRLVAERDSLKAQLRLKMDDWMAVCKEVDQRDAEIARLKAEAAAGRRCAEMVSGWQAGHISHKYIKLAADEALKGDAGKELLERVRRLEALAEAARLLRIDGKGLSIRQANERMDEALDALDAKGGGK